MLEQAGMDDTTRQAVLLVWCLTGLFVCLAFVLPDQVGAALPGRLLIFAAVSFVGSGLVYLSLLPVADGDAAAS